MKRIKLSIMSLLTVCLMALGGGSAFAAYGWGDTMNSAISLYTPGSGNSSAGVPLHHYNDNDWYVINNADGAESFWFQVILYPPSGINLDMQIVYTDANDNITKTTLVNHNGPGEGEAIGTSIKAHSKIYVRVMSAGYNDYDPDRAYEIIFNKLGPV